MSEPTPDPAKLRAEAEQLLKLIHDDAACDIEGFREIHGVIEGLLQALADASSRLATLEGEKAALEAEIAELKKRPTVHITRRMRPQFYVEE